MKREYPYIKGATEQGLFFWNNQLSAIHGRAADIAPDSGFSYFFNSYCGATRRPEKHFTRVREDRASSVNRGSTRTRGLKPHSEPRVTRLPPRFLSAPCNWSSAGFLNRSVNFRLFLDR